jgi:C4-type Zn-finger protein
MNEERTTSAAPKRPKCPSCARNMQLLRRTQRFPGLPDLCTFECEACGIFHFEEYEPPFHVDRPSSSIRGHVRSA